MLIFLMSSSSRSRIYLCILLHYVPTYINQQIPMRLCYVAMPTHEKFVSKLNVLYFNFKVHLMYNEYCCVCVCARAGELCVIQYICTNVLFFLFFLFSDHLIVTYSPIIIIIVIIHTYRVSRGDTHSINRHKQTKITSYRIIK